MLICAIEILNIIIIIIISNENSQLVMISTSSPLKQCSIVAASFMLPCKLRSVLGGVGRGSALTSVSFVWFFLTNFPVNGKILNLFYGRLYLGGLASEVECRIWKVIVIVSLAY